MTSFFYVVSYCHLSATLQTISIIIETYKSPGLRLQLDDGPHVGPKHVVVVDTNYINNRGDNCCV